jgi:predicted nucleic acid-binding protein
LSKKKGVAERPPEGLVLDCSIVGAWYFADESSDYADAVARHLAQATAYVPLLWSLEVANILVLGERRKRSTQAQATRFVTSLSAMPIVADDATHLHALSDTLNLARTHQLTSYDASYLELALRRGLPLATLDEKLKTAAGAVGVTLFNVPEKS